MVSVNIWFAGGEVPTYRRLLAIEEVRRIAVHFPSYVAAKNPLVLKDEFWDYEIVLYDAMGGGLDEADTATFIEANQDRLTYVLGIPVAKDVVPDRYIPLWNVEHGLAEFRALLSAGYRRIALTDRVVKDQSTVRQIVSDASAAGVDLWTVSSKVVVVGAGMWTDVVVSGWTNVQRQREVQIWDGSKVSRFSRDRRHEAVTRYADQIKRFGIDPQDIESEVMEPCLTLAIRSWREYEIVAIDRDSLSTAESISVSPVVAPHHPEVVTREAVNLPILVHRPSSEDDESSTVGIASTSFRSCDRCSLALACPKFSPGSPCGYRIPVQIRTKDELQAVMATLLEMQTQRILIARFEEDLLSQGLDETVSAELERFFRMVKAMKEISENRETLTITATTHAQAGALSRIFGSKVGEVNRALAEPIDSDDIIDATDV